MIYTYKEKKSAFIRLRGQNTHESDFALLAKLAPSHISILRFHRNKKKYADDIILCLLDLVPEEDIVAFRLKFAEGTVNVAADDPNGPKDEPKNEPKDEPKSDIEQRAEDAENRADEAENRAEEAEERAEEAEERAEEAEARADEAEQALEDEKKKE